MVFSSGSFSISAVILSSWLGPPIGTSGSGMIVECNKGRAIVNFRFGRASPPAPDLRLGGADIRGNDRPRLPRLPRPDHPFRQEADRRRPRPPPPRKTPAWTSFFFASSTGHTSASPVGKRDARACSVGTGTMGSPHPKQNPFAAAIPTRKPANDPGPAETATRVTAGLPLPAPPKSRSL